MKGSSNQLNASAIWSVCLLFSSLLFSWTIQVFSLLLARQLKHLTLWMGWWRTQISNFKSIQFGFPVYCISNMFLLVTPPTFSQSIRNSETVFVCESVEGSKTENLISITCPSDYSTSRAKQHIVIYFISMYYCMYSGVRSFPFVLFLPPSFFFSTRSKYHYYKVCLMYF